MKTADQSAFPQTFTGPYPGREELAENFGAGGLTVRQLFAVQIASGMFANSSHDPDLISPGVIATLAVGGADALIQELEK